MFLGIGKGIFQTSIRLYLDKKFRIIAFKQPLPYAAAKAARSYIMHKRSRAFAAFAFVSAVVRRAAVPALLIVFVLTAACAKGRDGDVSRPVSGDDYTLTILHTNDIHAAYGGLTAEGRICYEPVCGGGSGGSLRLLSAVEAVRAANAHVVLLDAGDEFQGTLFYNLHKEGAVAQVMNAVGYDAFAPGNHEFDDGPEQFLRLVELLHMPVLSANMELDKSLVQKSGAEAGQLPQPWVVMDIGGRSVGLIGILTTDTAHDSSPGPNVHFSNEIEALKRAVGELTADGVNIIIAVTHAGLLKDQELARAVPGVDVIVGGHSHSLLSNVNAKAEGPYPIVETSPVGEPVLVVTASFGGSLLGDLDVTFDGHGVAKNWDGEPIALTDENLKAMHAPDYDATLAARLSDYAKPVAALLAEPVAQINVPDFAGKPLEVPNVRVCRAEECLSGDIAADALLALPGQKIDAALVNGGAVRNSLPGGPVTMGDVLATFPFTNYAVVTEMPGHVLWAALEHGVSDYGQDKGRFLQVAGLIYTFDPTRPAGQCITSVRTADAQGNWHTLNPDATYRVATVDYLAGGGDGFTVFESLNWQDSGLLLSNVIGEYLQRSTPLAPRLEGRIVKE